VAVNFRRKRMAQAEVDVRQKHKADLESETRGQPTQGEASDDRHA